MPRKAASANANESKDRGGGKLRIGDDWNAIRIIALSQSNPLKAIAEFVENAIDAHAQAVTIARGREQGHHYLTVKDDGDGVPRPMREVAHRVLAQARAVLAGDGLAAPLDVVEEMLAGPDEPTRQRRMHEAAGMRGLLADLVARTADLDG